MNAGYVIFGFGVLALGMSYVLYKIANMKINRVVTARELDANWTDLGKMIVRISEDDNDPNFLKELDFLVGKSYKLLNTPSKNSYAENNKKDVKTRLKELQIEMTKSKTPYRIEIRRHKLYNLATLVGISMPKRKI